LSYTRATVQLSDVEIPNRALFKPSEVCEIASLQPYVLRSWESEFPDLGIAKGGASTRVYRRADVQRVLRIKQLVFSDGLTLAGVRRRIEEEAPRDLEPSAAEPISELFGRNARERLSAVRSGLREILDLLGGPPTRALQFHPPVASKPPARKASSVLSKNSARRTSRPKPQAKSLKAAKRKTKSGRR